ELHGVLSIFFCL
ncbi:hypothetical protein CPC197_0455, partial [Chlamydia psittaci C1/97]